MKTIDVKASTHFCESPITEAEIEERVAFTSSAYLIIIRGGMPGKMLRVVEGGASLGRSSENSFVFYDNTVSRQHATVLIDRRGSVSITDQSSTNGTFVNGQRLEPLHARRLTEGDRIQLGTSVILKLVFLDPSDERFQHEMFERTVRDGMTGLYNRAYFLNQVGGLSSRNAALGIGMAILMIDVDHFKRVNDRYGHLAGDCVLRGVAQVIREATRTEDLVARYGGEEFVVALPVSSPDLAIERAEQIRSSLAGRSIRAGECELRVTVSIGVAVASAMHAQGELELIEAADRALYQAKSEGRNRVVLGQFLEPFDPPQTESAEVVSFV